MRLKLKKLKAIRRFGWELTDFGNDSISSGGSGLDSVGQQVKASSFDIHSFSKDGEVFDITPNRTFVKFDLNQPGAWPRAFSANVFLAERDASGGFVEFLQKLWDAIGSQVIALTTALAVSALGASIGAVVGTKLMPLVGTIVGAIIGAVIGLVVGLLLDSLKDDIFESPENPISVILPSPNDLFPGNKKTSDIYMQEFSSGSARYLMSYYWELVY